MVGKKEENSNGKSSEKSFLASGAGIKNVEKFENSFKKYIGCNE